MPDIGTGDIEKSTANLNNSSYNDNSGLIIYKQQSKNKKSKLQNSNSRLSKSYDAGLNHVRLLKYSLFYF
jgi:hypothetical protein